MAVHVVGGQGVELGLKILGRRQLLRVEIHRRQTRRVEARPQAGPAGPGQRQGGRLTLMRVLPDEALHHHTLRRDQFDPVHHRQTQGCARVMQGQVEAARPMRRAGREGHIQPGMELLVVGVLGRRADAAGQCLADAGLRRLGLSLGGAGIVATTAGGQQQGKGDGAGKAQRAGVGGSRAVHGAEQKSRHRQAGGGVDSGKARVCPRALTDGCRNQALRRRRRRPMAPRPASISSRAWGSGTAGISVPDSVRLS
jgi:hypothetical protein